jgi:hypothetical protein
MLFYLAMLRKKYDIIKYPPPPLNKNRGLPYLLVFASLRIPPPINGGLVEYGVLVYSINKTPIFK